MKNANQEYQELIQLVETNYAKRMTDEQVKLFRLMAQQFGFNEFKKAMIAHLFDAESGQYFPKIADISKHVNGTEKDNKLAIEDKAQTQWQTVMRAISECGSYRTPTFRDSVTTAVICAMGNWSYLCSLTNEQLVWAGKEFVNHYRSYSVRPIEELPNHVQGLIDRGDQAKTLGELVSKLGMSNES